MAENNKNKVQDIATAGLAGVVVGAAVASAATMVLSDEKKRKKLQEKVNEMGDYVKRKASRVDDMAHKEMAKDKVNEATDTAAEKIKETSNTILDGTEKTMR
jgi:gas vesicle protein